jgi:glycosyltransferase involved in cell wall biosynthesis
MKIIYLIDDFPPDKMTSSGILTLNLAKKMLELGHAVSVITTVQNNSLAGTNNYQGIEVYKIYTKYHARWRAYLSLYNLQVIKKVEKIIKKEKPDVCHFQHMHTYISYHSFKIAKKYSQAVFLTAHDAMLFHYGKLTEFINEKDLSCPKQFNYKINSWQIIKRFKRRYNPFRNITIKYYLKYVDKIFAVSHALKSVLNQNKINNVTVINNGIDINEWEASIDIIENFRNKYNLNGKNVILFAGRLSFLKGGHVILEAMKKISKEISNTVLMVMGENDIYYQKMFEYAKKNNINIFLTGWLRGDELKAGYFVADLVVVPSICFDPFPTINLEAMTCSKPVVGTCFGGTSEVVENNKTGYIVNPHNTQEMAEKIINLLKDKSKMVKFGELGHQRIKEKFSLDLQVKKTLDWYKKFI